MLAENAGGGVEYFVLAYHFSFFSALLWEMDIRMKYCLEERPTVLAEGAVVGCWDSFLSSVISLLSLSHWETARYRLKYSLKGQFNPNQPPTIQPTNQPFTYDYLNV